jgi:Fe-S oxidoreductase
MQDTFTALDLCLACKGCKSECPSGVDMAKLKSTFQAEYYRTHHRPLRDYLFGYFHAVSACLSPLAGVANAIMQFSPTRRIISRLAGITEERIFPVYSKNAARASSAKSSPGGKRVLFLRDAFTHYIEPDVEQAALDLLAEVGCDVNILPVVGAGASLLSKGFIKSARAHATRLIRSIEKMDPSGEAMVVGLEPPEMYALKHDYPSLLPGEVIGHIGLEQRVWYLDEFLVRTDEFDGLRIAINNRAIQMQEKPKLKVLPHCHQRAEAPASDGRPSGTNATIHLLRSCGFEVEVIDSGCCGMAGTFGYEAEHYELSMLIEGRNCFLVRKFMPQAGHRLDRTGSACRLQIERG